MKKLIAFEINVPDSYLEREDRFMEELLKQLAANQEPLIFEPNRNHIVSTQINNIFTRNYEFVDEIKGW